MQNTIKKFLDSNENKTIKYNNDNWKVTFGNEFSITSSTFRFSMSNDNVVKLDSAMKISSYNSISIKSGSKGCYFMNHDETTTLTMNEINDIIEDKSAVLFQQSMMHSNKMIELIQCYIKHKQDFSTLLDKFGYSSIAFLDTYNRNIDVLLEEIYEKYKED